MITEINVSASCKPDEILQEFVFSVYKLIDKSAFNLKINKSRATNILWLEIFFKKNLVCLHLNFKLHVAKFYRLKAEHSFCISSLGY